VYDPATYDAFAAVITFPVIPAVNVCVDVLFTVIVLVVPVNPVMANVPVCNRYHVIPSVDPAILYCLGVFVFGYALDPIPNAKLVRTTGTELWICIHSPWTVVDGVAPITVVVLLDALTDPFVLYGVVVLLENQEFPFALSNAR